MKVLGLEPSIHPTAHLHETTLGGFAEIEAARSRVRQWDDGDKSADQGSRNRKHFKAVKGSPIDR